MRHDLRSDLLSSLAHEREEATFDFAHQIANPAATLLEYSGMLRASYCLKNDRMLPDWLSTIDKAIRSLIDERSKLARKLEGNVSVLPVVEG